MSAAIIKALVGVMGEVGSIAKNRKNPQQGYQFRGIDDVYNALQPALIKHGVVVAPSFESMQREERATKSGGTLIYTTVSGSFRFCHIDGSELVVKSYGEGMDSSDKSTNKAMSAAFKYALLQTLCIPTEDHIDSETDTPQPNPKSSAPPPEKPAVPATDAQRKALFAKGMARWDSRERVKQFADWLLAMGKMETFSREYISECLNDFDERAAMFEDEQRG